MLLKRLLCFLCDLDTLAFAGIEEEAGAGRLKENRILKYLLWRRGAGQGQLGNELKLLKNLPWPEIHIYEFPRSREQQSRLPFLRCVECD